MNAAAIALIAIAGLGLVLRRHTRAAAKVDPRRELASFAAHLARSCRGGLTVVEAASSAAPRLSGVVGESVSEVLSAVDRGLSLDTATRHWADAALNDGDRARGRSDPGDVELLVSAIRFADRYGAGLPEAFDSVAVALMDRCEMQQEVAALTSQARASVLVLCALPVIGVVMVSVISPATIRALLWSPMGLTLVVAASLLDLGAVLVSSWMTRLVLR
ncbi:MAG: type II secretion system F family protein [Microthrixaceae bacterium]|nr:type II secretion system F family protein [Microthrixaceae bacterium]MCB1012191.1 type II secretion system F family protein [Microthrixaceae bacterium]MCB9386879.1 type II secretion system F family protein [Microthrixaceae bacterium]MCO5321261.1 type II secretion system F family protein [Microthrixaceae bacterium]